MTRSQFIKLVIFNNWYYIWQKKINSRCIFSPYPRGLVRPKFRLFFDRIGQCQWAISGLDQQICPFELCYVTAGLRFQTSWNSKRLPPPPPPTETAFSLFLRQDKENFWQTVTFQLINSNLRCCKTFLRVDDIQYGFVIKVANQIDQDSSGNTLPQECKKSAQLHSVDQRFFVETEFCSWLQLYHSIF